MLRCLTGTVLFVEPETVVLDVAGLGFEVLCSRRALELCRPGEEVRLYAILQFQEGGASLFGFADLPERDLFRKLTGVKGVGGKMAMALLKELPLSAIIRALGASDLKTLSQVPGIGKRTAERLCFEMKRHLGDFEGILQVEDSPSPPGEDSLFVLEALQSLGFARNEAARALEAVRARNIDGVEGGTSGTDESVLLHEALRELNKVQGR